MGTNRQGFLHDLSTPVALLRSEASGNFYHSMTSSCSLIFKYFDKRSPTGIGYALGKRMIVEHAVDIQVFNAETLITLCVRLGCLKEKIPPLTLDFQMCFSGIAGGFAPSFTPLFASAEGTLFTSQRLLALAIVAWIRNSLALRIGQEDLQADIQANIGMHTHASGFLMGLLCLCWLTDDERIPMTIGAQNKMSRLGRALYRTMQLDFQKQAQLGRNMQVLPICVQPHIAALRILAKLNAMPAVRGFEARKAAGQTLLFEGEIPSEGLIQSISQCLDRSGRHRVGATSLEAKVQVVLEEEFACLRILLLRGCQHLVVQAPRVFQADHQLLVLLLGWIETILIRSHILIIFYRASSVNNTTGARFIPLSKKE